MKMSLMFRCPFILVLVTTLPASQDPHLSIIIVRPTRQGLVDNDDDIYNNFLPMTFVF